MSCGQRLGDTAPLQAAPSSRVPVPSVDSPGPQVTPGSSGPLGLPDSEPREAPPLAPRGRSALLSKMGPGTEPPRPRPPSWTASSRTTPTTPSPHPLPGPPSTGLPHSETPAHHSLSSRKPHGAECGRVTVTQLTQPSTTHLYPARFRLARGPSPQRGRGLAGSQPCPHPPVTPPGRTLRPAPRGKLRPLEFLCWAPSA